MTMHEHSDPNVVVLHAAPRPAVSGRRRRWLVVGLLVLTAAVGVGVKVGVQKGFLPNPVVAGDPAAKGHDEPVVRSGPQAVKVVRPKRDPSVQVAVEQLATVEAYYRADLRARASGLVRAVHKDIGDRVHRGDLLVEIDVPDLTQEVAQKEAAVNQRRQELRVSRANLKNIQAGRDVADATVREKQAMQTQAEATRDFRRKRLERYRVLAARGSLVEGALDEEERDAAASEAGVLAAQVAVERGRADLVEAEAKVEAATADIDLKGALIDVALRDLDRARAMADYARVAAPFDGVVVRRTVDPGSFVQNATSGSSDSLISVARTDLVTLVARFPDSVAPYITPATEATFNADNLPGAAFTGRVTRFAPAIDQADRTMRVEVDLFNGDEKDAAAIRRRVLGTGLGPLTPDLFASAAARGAGTDMLLGLQKGSGGELPVGAVTATSAARTPRLIPGTSGTMKLGLQSFSDGCVLPSTAVYSRSGKPYLLLVEDGKTRQVPVRVQLNDGKVTKVAVLGRAVAGREVLTELTGREQVIAARQLEIGDGVAVTATATDW